MITPDTITYWKRINTVQSYSTIRKYPKLEAILEKLDLKAIIWINNNQERETNFMYSKQLLKTFNERVKSVLKQLKQIKLT